MERWDSTEVATIGQLTRDAVAIEREMLQCGFLQEQSDAYMGIPTGSEATHDEAWRKEVCSAGLVRICTVVGGTESCCCSMAFELMTSRWWAS